MTADLSDAAAAYGHLAAWVTHCGAIEFRIGPPDSNLYTAMPLLNPAPLCAYEGDSEPLGWVALDETGGPVLIPADRVPSNADRADQ